MKNVGEIEDFRLQPFLDAANELMRADETIRALNLLDNLPAYQRDHVPSEISTLKKEIMARIATPNFYATSRGELTTSDESSFAMEKALRGIMIIREVEILNKAGFVPHIYDYGTGEFWMPQMLNNKNLNFTYFPIYLNYPSFEFYKNRYEKHMLLEKPKDQPIIFYACEVIEHLWQEKEIRFEMQRHADHADVVHISTPCYTFDTPCRDWKTKGDIGHLRAYTPTEFLATVVKIFPDYNVYAYQSQILHARLTWNETKYDIIKNSLDLMADKE